ncbi:hypothetical protein [Natronobacterium gregoryi]|nr:hypothetical protein [Natronobacterium gregoryi]
MSSVYCQRFTIDLATDPVASTRSSSISVSTATLTTPFLAGDEP